MTKLTQSIPVPNVASHYNVYEVPMHSVNDVPASVPTRGLCGGGGSGLLATGLAYQLTDPSSNPGIRLPIFFGYPPSCKRSSTFCHNTILDGITKLYVRGASAGSISLSRGNEASLKNI